MMINLFLENVSCLTMKQSFEDTTKHVAEDITLNYNCSTSSSGIIICKNTEFSNCVICTLHKAIFHSKRK